MHTALSFPVLGEDVLITGAGPIGIMAAAVVRHAGARHVVVTESIHIAWTWPKNGRDAGPRRPRQDHRRRPKRNWAWRKASTSAWKCPATPKAFRDMLANMAHGGKIAMLGIPEKEMAIDWNPVVFNMLTIKGIYGREMYETWYKMTVMLQSGLDIKPIITHRFRYDEFQKGFEVMLSGQSGKVILDWH